jgi:hypothetical protein
LAALPPVAAMIDISFFQLSGTLFWTNNKVASQSEFNDKPFYVAKIHHFSLILYLKLLQFSIDETPVT